MPAGAAGADFELDVEVETLSTSSPVSKDTAGGVFVLPPTSALTDRASDVLDLPWGGVLLSTISGTRASNIAATDPGLLKKDSRRPGIRGGSLPTGVASTAGDAFAADRALAPPPFDADGLDPGIPDDI